MTLMLHLSTSKRSFKLLLDENSLSVTRGDKRLLILLAPSRDYQITFDVGDERRRTFHLGRFWGIATRAKRIEWRWVRYAPKFQKKFFLC